MKVHEIRKQEENRTMTDKIFRKRNATLPAGLPWKTRASTPLQASPPLEAIKTYQYDWYIDPQGLSK